MTPLEKLSKIVGAMTQAPWYMGHVAENYGDVDIESSKGLYVGGLKNETSTKSARPSVPAYTLTSHSLLPAGNT